MFSDPWCVVGLMRPLFNPTDDKVAMDGELLTRDLLSSVGLIMNSAPSANVFRLGNNVGSPLLMAVNAVSIVNSDPSRDIISRWCVEISGSGVGSSTFLDGVAGPASADDEIARFLPVIWASPGNEVP